MVCDQVQDNSRPYVSSLDFTFSSTAVERVHTTPFVILKSSSCFFSYNKIENMSASFLKNVSSVILSSCDLISLRLVPRQKLRE